MRSETPDEFGYEWKLRRSLTRANGMQKLRDYDAITLAENFASNSLLGTSLLARSPRKCLAATKAGLHEDMWSTCDANVCNKRENWLTNANRKNFASNSLLGASQLARLPRICLSACDAGCNALYRCLPSNSKLLHSTCNAMQCNAMLLCPAGHATKHNNCKEGSAVQCNSKANSKATAKGNSANASNAMQDAQQLTSCSESARQTASERRDAIKRVPNGKKRQESKSGRVEEEERS
jgi:hypothetical protein